MAMLGPCALECVQCRVPVAGFLIGHRSFVYFILFYFILFYFILSCDTHVNLLMDCPLGTIDLVVVELLLTVMVMILLVMDHARCYSFTFVADYLV
jgi:hypothetical protein